MDLQHYLDILKRRALVIVLVTAIALVVVVSTSLLTTPVYTAKATIRVLLDVGVSDFNLAKDYTVRLMNTYGFVLESDSLKNEALKRLEPQYGAEASKGLQQLRANAIPDSELIQVTVQHENQAIARDMANTMATLLTEYSQNLYVGNQKSSMEIIDEQLKQVANETEGMYQQLADLVRNKASAPEIEALQNQIRFEEDSYQRLLDRYELARLKQSLRANSVSIVQPALLPRRPSNALGLQEIGVTLVVGLLGGIGLALVLENLDTRFRSARHVEHATHLPVIGSVPRGILNVNDKAKRDRSLEEAYRVLALNVQTQAQGRGIKTILITSAVSKEGKSVVASNLAQMLAERDRTIFLVESDMRHPTFKERFGVENGHPGLSYLLTDGSTLGEALFPTDQPSLFVISAGPTPSNPTALLASPNMAKVLSYLSNQAQFTLLDAPPVLGIADVSLLAPCVDGILLVVNQEVSRREQVLEVLKQLNAIEGQVLGIVFLRKNGRTLGYY